MAGAIMAEVARSLRVSRQSVSRWYHDWRRGGRAALRVAGRAGRKTTHSARALERMGLRRTCGPCRASRP